MAANKNKKQYIKKRAAISVLLCLFPHADSLVAAVIYVSLAASAFSRKLEFCLADRAESKSASTTLLWGFAVSTLVAQSSSMHFGAHILKRSEGKLGK